MTLGFYATSEQQREQERPAARRGGRCVGTSELEGLGVGGREEAHGISEGRSLKIVPCDAGENRPEADLAGKASHVSRIS